MPNARTMSVGTLTRRLDEKLASGIAWDDFHGAPRVFNPASVFGIVEHFAGATSTLSQRLLSTTGLPSITVASRDGGAVTLAVDATVEDQFAGYDTGDVAAFRPAKGVYLEAKLNSFSGGGAAFFILGLGIGATTDLWHGMASQIFVEIVLADGAVKVRHKDSAGTTTSFNTGLNVPTTGELTVRMELFRSDGVRLYLPGGTLEYTGLSFDDAPHKLVVGVGKLPTADTGTAELDYVAAYGRV